MIRILSKESMSITDKKTMYDKDVNEIDLVCKAANECFKSVQDIAKNKKIVVACGNSNNSSDGFKLAKILRENNYDCIVFYDFELSHMNKTCTYFYEDYMSEYKEFITNDVDIFNSCDYIIDALIGNGLNGPLREKMVSIVNDMNNSKAIKVAIDLPTGLDSDTGNFCPVCVHADYTLAISNLKLGHVLSDGPDVCGKVKILDIGLNSYDDLEHVSSVDLDEYRDYFDRKYNSNKYDYGNVLVIGSNVSMPGAGIMSSLSALKSGSGLVTLACPKENLDIVSIKAPLEIMVKSIDDENILNKKDTVVFGPGLKNDDRFIPLLEKLLSLEINLIVDADGLGLLSKINGINMKRANLVITPHIGEASRLLNKSSSEIKADIFGSFKELIDMYDCMVVLKGHNTLVGDKSSYYISLSGNSGMATAGSGDVLSGIIAGVSGKEMSLKSVLLGVYIHGLAGDIAKEKVGETSLMASDIISNIPYAIENVKKENKK